MKNHPSRRLFLRNTAIATTGVTLISSTTFANSLISNNSPFDGYNPYAEEIADLRVSKLFGKHLQVKGTIFDSTGSFGLSNVTVEVWHLSPNSKKYRHRSKLTTNNLGEYNFITDFPYKEYGKPSSIYFKVSNSNKEYFTELLLNDFGANISGKHWSENKQLGNKLLPIKKGGLNDSNIVFNITL